VRVLLAASFALSCGRIGYGLLAVPDDAGPLGGLRDAAPAADANGTDGGHAVRDGASDDAVVPGDGGADGSPRSSRVPWRSPMAGKR
jgi:hypothetical protein